MAEDAAPSLPNLLYGLGGAMATILVPQLPGAIRWCANVFLGASNKYENLLLAENKRLNEKLDKYELRMEQQDKLIEELRHNLAELTRQVGQNQEGVAQLKQDSSIITKTAAVVRNIVEPGM